MSAIDLHARASATFDAKLAETEVLLRQAAKTHFGKITQASSLGAEDVVITHLVQALKIDIPIFVLETGKLHDETLALLETQRKTLGDKVKVYAPNPESVIHFVAREGNEPMYKSIALRKACCHIRKMEPLERALKGKTAWVTGLRREQSGSRADVPLLDEAEFESKGRFKFNPLANWTWGDVWHYIKINSVAYNPLHDQFFPSIGCAPCTRAISLGEDFRAGRWWWEANLEGGSAKECGLHVAADAEVAEVSVLR
jgi:phosphoadenosine phosphosulfate reductase